MTWRLCPQALTLLGHHQTGQSAIFCGRSGKQLKRCRSSQPGALLDSWARMVRSLHVSSSVSQASRLIDGSEPCWQSSGSQGKVLCPGHLLRRFLDGFAFQSFRMSFANLRDYTVVLLPTRAHFVFQFIIISSVPPTSVVRDFKQHR